MFHAASSRMRARTRTHTHTHTRTRTRLRTRTRTQQIMQSWDASSKRAPYNKKTFRLRKSFQGGALSSSHIYLITCPVEPLEQMIVSVKLETLTDATPRQPLILRAPIPKVMTSHAMAKAGIRKPNLAQDIKRERERDTSWTAY